jgi:hypothetical protein
VVDKNADPHVANYSQSLLSFVFVCHPLLSIPWKQATTTTSDEPQKRIINGQQVVEDRYPYFSLMNEKAMCGMSTQIERQQENPAVIFILTYLRSCSSEWSWQVPS